MNTFGYKAAAVFFIEDKTDLLAYRSSLKPEIDVLNWLTRMNKCFFPSSSSYLNFIIKSRSHRGAESEELINQIISVDRRQNVEGQTRQLKKNCTLLCPFFEMWLPFIPPQIMCLLPRWRWTLMEGSCRTTSPAEATALEGPSPLLCTTGSQLLDRTCSWTCILPLLWVRASLCSLLAQRASPRWRMMQDFTTACIRDLSVTCRPLLQLCPHVLG